MKITQVILVFLLGLSTVNCACGEGTLQCSTEDKPLICDFTSSYVLNEAKDGCEKKTVEGCEVINPDAAAAEKCLLCEMKKVLDTEKAKCVDVLVDNQKENCERYNATNSTCTGCATDFFVSSGSCVAVGETKIENCMVYETATTCKSCSSGYYLKDNACPKLETVANCYAHSNIKCDACAAGYILNSGLNAVVEVNSSLLDTLALGSQETPSMSSSNSMSVCQKHDVTNCSVFETFDKCTTCNSMYMVTPEFKCQYYPEDPIAHCAKYSNATTCTECLSTHFLSGNTCEERTADANCETWTVTANTCAECKATFYITSVSGPPATTSCVARDPTTYKNCAALQLSLDECKTCNVGYDMTVDKKACLITSPNCASQTAASVYGDVKHTCTSCNDGYTLDAGSCGGTPVTECQDHDANTSTCNTCNPGFYLSGNTCPAQNVSDCNNDYTANKNQCETCVNLKKPSTPSGDDPNTCGNIANSNCFTSNGKTDDCTVCMPGFILAANKCDGSRAATNVPANCESNTGTADDTDCASCNSTYLLVTGDSPYASDTELAGDNCEAVDYSTGSCSQCKANFKLTSGSCVDDTSNATTNICTQSVVSTADADLTAGSNCAVCNSALGKIADSSNDCVDYSISNQFNCATKGPSQISTCAACAAGFDYIDPSYLTCATGNFTTITNCLVYSSMTTCMKCSAAFVPNVGNYQSCVARGASFLENTFGWDTSPQGTKDYTASVGNCSTYSQITPTVIGCTKCNANYVGIVATLSGFYEGTKAAGTYAHSYINGVSGDADFSSYPQFTACSNSPAEVDSPFTGSNCELGVFFTNPGVVTGYTAAQNGRMNEKYACIKCEAGFQGTLGTINATDTDVKTFANPFIHIVSCGGSSISTTYSLANGTGFGYNSRFVENQASWNSFFNYSKCTSGTVFYHVKRTPNASSNNQNMPFEFTGTSTNNFECVTNSAHLTYGTRYTSDVTFCAAAIYASGATALATINAATDVECLACKTGYKATINSTTSMVETCTAIAGCDSSGPFKPLNACAVHANPWTTTKSGEYHVVNFDTPHSAAIANCSVTDGTKCLMCIPGNQPSSDGLSCTALTLDNTGCSGGLGVGQNNLYVASSPISAGMGDEAQQFMTFMQVRNRTTNFEATYGPHNSMMCEANCATGNMIFIPSQTVTRRVCGKNVSSPAFTNSADCTLPNGAGVGCQACTSDSFIPNNSVDECVLKSTKTNCTSVTASQKDCVTCDAGFIEVSGACVESFCEEYNTAMTSCLVCKENSRPHATDAKLCLAPVTADLTHECQYWSGQIANANYCVKCRADNTIPYVFENGSKFSSTCQPWTKGSAELGYIHPYTNVYMKVSGSSFQYKVMSVKTVPSWSNKEYENKLLGGKTGKNNCMKERTVANCATMISNMYCSACDPTHYLDESNNSCVANTVAQCKVSSANVDECTTCNDDYFLENSTTCTVRVVSKNCELADRVSNLDKCSACNNVDKWFKSADGTCNDYTVTNCDGKNATQDLCTTCAQKFYANTTSTLSCDSVTNVDNCKTYSTTENKCTVCNDNAWYDIVTAPATPACPLRTEIQYCTATPTNEDSCTTCEGDRYYNSTNKECRDYPVGTANCLIYEYPDKCVQCDSGYFLSSGACSAVTEPVTGCMIHSSATACGTCTPGTHIANGAACDTITQKTGCLAYSDKDTCSSCSGNYFLEEGACVASGITGCAEAVKGTPNTCSTCEPNRYINAEKTSCTAGTAVAGCAVYKDQNTCTTCSTSKLMNADGTKCDTLTTQAGAECSLASTLAAPACDVCMLGYQKDSEGMCVAVPVSNCLVADAAGKCVMCIPKTHWMNKEGTCEAVPEEECTGDDCDGQDILRFSFTLMLAFFILRLF